ncbi:MAG: hypothetical protein HYR96_14195 [Deltaproteobacteria bacterium]|nr:hypothetical protein [Deltaproteobacteria bacterium]MBI3296413.1 hypothetical protein [Deltaproteobacteria bacterium]
MSCPHCTKTVSVNSFQAQCPECLRSPFPFLLPNESLEQCPVCGCRDLYKHKDFNRNIGIGILIVGVVSAYWTYGISLLVVTALDYLIFRGVDSVGICYHCLTQYRGKAVAPLSEFNLTLHDHYRLVRENRAK